MAKYIKENIQIIKKNIKILKQMEIDMFMFNQKVQEKENILVSLNKVKLKVMGNGCLRMVANILVSLLIIICMDMENFMIVMEIYIADNGKKI